MLAEWLPSSSHTSLAVVPCHRAALLTKRHGKFRDRVTELISVPTYRHADRVIAHQICIRTAELRDRHPSSPPSSASSIDRYHTCQGAQRHLSCMYCTIRESAFIPNFMIGSLGLLTTSGNMSDTLCSFLFNQSRTPKKSIHIDLPIR